MTEGVLIIVWLVLGGWAFNYWGREAKAAELAGLFFGCLLLAPFAFGASLADRRSSMKRPG